MDGLSIIGISVVVGLVVYALSLRGADEYLTTDLLQPEPEARPRRGVWRRRRAEAEIGTSEQLGFGPSDAERPLADEQPEPESFVYVPVLAAPGIGWQRRIAGVVGLLALVTVSAAVVAVSVYQLGHVLNQTVRGFLK